MDLSLTAEQELIIGMVRRFVREEILPLEQHLDQTQTNWRNQIAYG